MDKRTSEETRATETRLERTERVTEANLAHYSSRDRLTDQPLRATEEDANRCASMINHAIALSDNGNDYMDVHGLGLMVTSRPIGTGETHGLIEIASANWYVVVGTFESPILSPKWYLRNEGDAIEVAKALIFTIESYPDMLEALNKWSDRWMK